MATRKKPAKKKARKTSPCKVCKSYSVTPSRNAKGQFKKTGRAKRR